MFPIVIEILTPHGLESSATKGRDYYTYLLVEDEEQLNKFLGQEIKIVATNVKCNK